MMILYRRALPILIIICTFLILGCKDKRNFSDIEDNINVLLNDSNYISLKKEIAALRMKKPNYSNVYFYQALLDKHHKSNRDALHNLSKAIALDSTNYSAFIERAKIKIELGDYKSALMDCDNAIRLNSTNPQSFIIKADAYIFLKNNKNAIKVLRKGILFGAKSGIVYYKLGTLQLSIGEAEQACENLSKAGELGYMKAFDIIKDNCNGLFLSQDNNMSQNAQTRTNKEFQGQFKIYPKRFSITFPLNWRVSSFFSSDNSTLVVTAQSDDLFMSVNEVSIMLDTHRINNIWDIDKEDLLSEYKMKYQDYNLINSERVRVNDIPAYYFKLSFSFYSEKLQKRLSGTIMEYNLINPNNNNLIVIQSNTDQTKASLFEPIFRGSAETFKFNE